MVTILQRELEHKVKKVQHLKLEVMRPKTKNQHELPAWINHNWSVHINGLWRKRMEGEGPGEGQGEGPGA